MDPAKDDRSARLEQRNALKDTERSSTLPEDTDRKFPDFTTSTVGRPTEDYGTTVKSDDKDYEAYRPYATSSHGLAPVKALRSVSDSFAPSSFSGSDADADARLAHFQRYTEYRQIPDPDIVALFPLFLIDSTTDWYETLSPDVKNNLKELLDNFKSYFGKSELDYFFTEEPVFTRTQRPREKAPEYIAEMQKLASRIPGLAGEVLLYGVSSDSGP